MTSIIKALEWRYATKKFDSTKKIPEAEIEELLEIARLAPSSYGLQPWKFVLVKNPAIRHKLRLASWNQAQVTDASHFIVLCARTDADPQFVKKYIKSIADTRQTQVESLKGFEEMINGSVATRSSEQLVDWNKRQVYIALGMLLEAAALKGIDTCPMEGFDSMQYDEILGLKDHNVTATVLLALGYRGEDPTAKNAKVRFAKNEVVIEK